MSLWATAAANDCTGALARGEEYLKAKQFEQAAVEYRSAAASCSPKPDLHVTLGQVLYLAGKEAEAEHAFRQALAMDEGFLPAHYNLGRLLYHQKRYLEATASYRRAVEIDPAHYRAWDNLGLTYDALNQDSDALRSFFKALDLVMKDQPDYDWAHANLADFFLRRNEYEKAFQLAAEAARRNPQSARNCFLTGKALVKLDKHDLSLRWLRRAIELDDTYPEAYYLLAQTCRKVGREDEAAQALERFKELNQNPRARR